MRWAFLLSTATCQRLTRHFSGLADVTTMPLPKSILGLQKEKPCSPNPGSVQGPATPSAPAPHTCPLSHPTALIGPPLTVISTQTKSKTRSLEFGTIYWTVLNPVRKLIDMPTYPRESPTFRAKLILTSKNWFWWGSIGPNHRLAETQYLLWLDFRAKEMIVAKIKAYWNWWELIWLVLRLFIERNVLITRPLIPLQQRLESRTP